jgi:uncharacterized protein (DUF302 family)
MSYYYAKTFTRPFDGMVAATRRALEAEGFGIITEIDVQQTMRSKLDVDIRPYLILGACNPRLAFEALQLENKVGTMLPCNVIVQDVGEGTTEVAAVDPVASMQAIENADLRAKAAAVGEKLRSAIERLDQA